MAAAGGRNGVSTVKSCTLKISAYKGDIVLTKYHEMPDYLRGKNKVRILHGKELLPQIMAKRTGGLEI